MGDKPDDRPKKVPPGRDNDPKIFIVIDDRKFPRPGLETFFAEPHSRSDRVSGCSCHPVVSTYCSCNKVCTCVPVSSVTKDDSRRKVTSSRNRCSCVPVSTSKRRCSCVGYTRRRSSCSCVRYTRSSCSCVGYTRRSGGYGCRCAPVH